ncbi:MAG: hypothetical protein H7Y13_12195 [Sphingobacteriaceae bacterium]|nr:hypothetical protein [Sphingobacteriaceae bacterium]
MNISKGMEDELFLFLEKENYSGKKWLVYEAGSLIKSQKDFVCFTTEFDASQYAHDNTSDFDVMIVKPIAEIKASIQQELFEQAIEHALNSFTYDNAESILKELANTGFKSAELGDSLRRDFASFDYDIPYETVLNNTPVKFYIQLSKDGDGCLHYSGYDGIVRPEQREIQHGTFNNIDTAALDEAMGKINWKEHPGNFFYSPEDRNNPEIREMWYLEKQLDKLIDRNWQTSENIKSQAMNVWEALMVKHFADTPLMKAIIGTVPYLQASFEQRIPFSKGVSLTEASQVLKKLNNKNQVTSENNKIMNSQNLEFLQSSLKYFGFGDKLNQALENNIKEQKAEFQLKLEIPHFNNKMDFTLHFKKSDSSEMYFFNRYDAALQNGTPEQDKMQSFYINKGNGITAKEAFNLLEGRSVHKDLVTKDGEKYSAWLKLDFADTDNKGNHKLKQYTEQYGFNLDKTLAAFPIKEMSDPKQKEQLLNSLQKGNAQQVTLTRDGKDDKFYIEAVPQFKTINVYDQKMHMVKRQNFQEPNSINGESAKTNQKHSEKQKTSKDTEDRKPKQGQSRKRKLTV